MPFSSTSALHSIRNAGVAIAIIIGVATAVFVTNQSMAKESRDKSPTVTRDSISTMPASTLPKQGIETLALIRKGGPFPYSKDGTTFGNRERLLPREARGFYKEYTVKTPGSRDRGARRIVCGGADQRDPKKSDCYYTADHYGSFKRIIE
jgi:ribonuclease T1